MHGRYRSDGMCITGNAVFRDITRIGAILTIGIGAYGKRGVRGGSNGATSRITTTIIIDPLQLLLTAASPPGTCPSACAYGRRWNGCCARVLFLQCGKTKWRNHETEKSPYGGDSCCWYRTLYRRTALKRHAIDHAYANQSRQCRNALRLDAGAWTARARPPLPQSLASSSRMASSPASLPS